MFAAVVAMLVAGCASSPEVEPAPAAALDPVGTYSLSTTIQGMAVDGQMRITGTPGSYDGSAYTDTTGEIPFTRVTVDGNRVSITADSPEGPLEIRLVFDGDAFTGSWEMGTDGGSIRGQRIRR